MDGDTNKPEQSLARIPQDLQSIFVPQLKQLGADPFAVPFGVAARLDNTVASGWFWTCAVDEDCLVTTMHLVAHQAFVLREIPEVDYFVLALLSSVDARLINAMRRTQSVTDDSSDPLMEDLFPTLQRTVVAFAMRQGPREFELPAGSLHDSCNICMLPSFLQRIEGLLGEDIPALAPSFKRGTDLSDSKRLFQTMRDIAPAEAVRAGAPLHYRALVLDALAEMVSCLRERGRTNAPLDLRPDAHVADAVSAELLSSLADPPSLDTLAERLYLGKTRLCQRFKDETGMSIGEMLAHLRVSEAKRRLECGNDPISEIAHAVGYAHASSFTTMFTRLVGTSPHAWREQHRHPYAGTVQLPQASLDAGTERANRP